MKEKLEIVNDARMFEWYKRMKSWKKRKICAVYI